MHAGQDLVALIPTVAFGQPAGAFGHDEEGEEEDNGGDHLQSPRETPGRGSIQVAATVGDVKHDQDTPSDGPLLGADHLAPFGRLRQLRDVDGNLGAADTDGVAANEAADNELGDAERRAGDGAPDAPDDCADLDGPSAAKHVGEKARRKSTHEGAAGHGGGDASLVGRGGTRAVVIFDDPLVEEALVLLGAKARWSTSPVSKKNLKMKDKTREEEEEPRSTYMADIDAMSKPNSAPPMTATVVIT